MEKNILPNFLVVGLQRTGTTWLYEVLKTHPNVFLPYVKEVHYYDNNYDKGVDWYQSFFRNNKNEKCIGDITPNYIHRIEIASLIHDLIPDSKIIIILRNPVDFLYSIYMRRSRISPRIEPFELFIKDAKIYTLGLYYEKVMAYIKKFPRKNIFIGLYEDFEKDVESYVNSLCFFLEIDPNKINADLRRIINPTVKPKYVFLHRYAHIFVKRIKDIRSPSLAIFFRKIRPLFNNRFYMMAIGSGKDTEMSDTSKKMLYEYYYADVIKLSELLERDLILEWNFPNKGENRCLPI